MTKLAVLTCAFNEKDFIVPCIKQFDGFGLPHLVLVSRKPWRGNWPQDETWALARMHLGPFNGTVEDGEWATQANQLNYGLEILQGAGQDWALIVDADEFYTAVDIGRLIGEIRNAPATTQSIKAANMFVYWKTPKYSVIPKQYDCPVVAIRTNQRFVDKRSAGLTEFIMSSAELHHMSYVRSDDDMLKKIESFEHSEEFDREAWYKNIWSKWAEESLNLHPTVPSQFHRAVNMPAPYEIQRLINWAS